MLVVLCRPLSCLVLLTHFGLLVLGTRVFRSGMGGLLVRVFSGLPPCVG